MNVSPCKSRDLLICSIIFSLASSSSILLCLFVGNNKKVDMTIRIVFPLIFWVGLIAEQYFLWRLNSLRKKSNISQMKNSNERIGLLSIFKNKYAIITDVIFMISLIGLAILMIFKVGESSVQYISIFILVLSFRLHCILNGKNFRYINNYSKRKVQEDVK